MRLRTRPRCSRRATSSLLAIVALEIPLALDLRDRVDAEVRSQADGQADLVAASAARPARAARSRASSTRARPRGGRTVRGRVIVVDRDGAAAGRQPGAGRPGASYATAPRSPRALRGDAPSRHAPQRHARHRPARDRGADRRAAARIVGAVRVTQSVAARPPRRAATIVELVLVGVAVLLMGLVAGRCHRARRSRGRCGASSATARRVAGGDLDARADAPRAAPSSARWRGSFNEMTDAGGRAARAPSGASSPTPRTSCARRWPACGCASRRRGAAGRRRRADLDAADARGRPPRRIVDDLLALSRTGERGAPARDVRPRRCRRVAPPSASRARRRASRRRAAGRDEAPAAPSVAARRADLDRMLDVLMENALALRRRRRRDRDRRACRRDRGARPRARAWKPARRRRCSSASIAARPRRRDRHRSRPLDRARIARGWGGEVTLRARAGGGAVAAIVIPVERGSGSGAAADAGLEVPA